MPSAAASPATALHDEVATLYADHHGWLRNWLRRRLGDAHQAADLAQDTFVRLLLHGKPVQAQEPRAYLTTVAGRVLINHYRRQQLEHAYLAAVAQLPPALALSPEERHLMLEALDLVDRALDGLPAPVRRAFLLSQLEGAMQADIARELGVSLATVKRYIVQAGVQCYFAVHG